MAAVDMPPSLSPLPSDEDHEGDCDEQEPKSYLQKVLSERNNLRAQNSQLWKIVQKQRVIIQQLQKTLSSHDPRPQDEAEVSFSQPSTSGRSKSRQRGGEEGSSRIERHARRSVLEDLDSLSKKSIDKDSIEKPIKNRRESVSRPKEERIHPDTRMDVSTSSKDELSSNRRSKTLPPGYRQVPGNDRKLDTKKPTKEVKNRRSKDLSQSFGSSLSSVLTDTLVIEASPAPENSIKSRVVEYKVKKVDPGNSEISNKEVKPRKTKEVDTNNILNGSEIPEEEGASEKILNNMDVSSETKHPLNLTEDGVPLLSPSVFEDPSKNLNASTVAVSSDNGSLDNKDIREVTSKDSQQASSSLRAPGHQRRATLPGGAELSTLENILVHVVGCTVKVNSRGKEALIFRIQISRSDVAEDSPNAMNHYKHLWTIEKLFSDLLELDNQLRLSGQNVKNPSVKLPEKKAWNTSSPSKIDQRKLMLQNYLQLAINNNLNCPNVMSEFISTHQVDEAETNTPAGEKEGYLSKRGKNFGKWKRRYFSLNESVLEYFESKNGTKLGEIFLASAQVAVQHTSSSEYEPDASSVDTFRHAFMILEPKRGTQVTLRHVLCADSDAERDDWVKAIGFHFTGEPQVLPLPEAETETVPIVSDSTVSPPHQELTIPDKPAVLGITTNADMSNQSSTSLGSFSSANSDSRPNDATPTPLRSRTISKPGDGHVVNIPNVMPKILKEEPPRPPRKAFFWGKRIFSGDSAKNRPPQLPVFGVALHQSVAASKVLEGYSLSSVVYRCIQYLDAKKAQLEEGIYRLSGSSATIRLLRTKFDTEGDYGLVDSGVYYDVHAVAGLLKLYLRELPSTVLTAELHRDFLQITELPTRRLRVRELGRLICSLPIENYTLLRALIGHLIVIVQEAETNKMTLKNIGIVFAPTLGVPAGVFSLLMAEFKYVFYIDPEGTAIPQELSGDEEPPPPSPISVPLQDQFQSSDARDRRRAKHRRTVSADTVMDLSKGVNILLNGTAHESIAEDEEPPSDLSESHRSKRNSVIYRNRAPPDFVRLERQAETIAAMEELPDDISIEP